MTWTDFVSRLLIVVIAFPLHEFGHAWTAHYFGDDTGKEAGRLTLNPLKHIDVFGAVCLMLFGFGWAKPVPVNQMKLREKSKLAPILAIAAGAIMNFLLMAVLFVVIRILLQTSQNVSINLLEILVQFMMINVILVVFNLLPIPPLDGFMILGNLLPPSMDKVMAVLSQYGILILLVVVYLLPKIGFDPFGNLLSASMNFVWNLLINF